MAEGKPPEQVPIRDEIAVLLTKYVANGLYKDDELVFQVFNLFRPWMKRGSDEVPEHGVALACERFSISPEVVQEYVDRGNFLFYAWNRLRRHMDAPRVEKLKLPVASVFFDLPEEILESLKAKGVITLRDVIVKTASSFQAQYGVSEEDMERIRFGLKRIHEDFLVVSSGSH